MANSSSTLTQPNKEELTMRAKSLRQGYLDLLLPSNVAKVVEAGEDFVRARKKRQRSGRIWTEHERHHESVAEVRLSIFLDLPTLSRDEGLRHATLRPSSPERST